MDHLDPVQPYDRILKTEENHRTEATVATEVVFESVVQDALPTYSPSQPSGWLSFGSYCPEGIGVLR
jgi:hypothetical protein